MNFKNVCLIQPANPNGKQTYLPGGLMNLGSRLLAAGVTVSFADLNHDDLGSPSVREKLVACDMIGLSVLGPPYVPGVVSIIEAIRNMGFVQPILIGGEGVARVSVIDFKAWFPMDGVYQIRNDRDIEQAMGLMPMGLLPEGAVSMAPMLRILSEEARKRYLTSEFCLFLSRGCGYNCSFCSADKAKKEQYRSLSALEEELEYLCSQIARFGHPEFRVYVSNLDSLQTPHMFEVCLEHVAAATKKHGLRADVRGLATLNRTAAAHKKDPDYLTRLHNLGLSTLAFGADGADEGTWKREGKCHNTVADLENAIQATRAAGITIEILMVIGFQGIDLKAAGAALTLSFREALKGSIIRPYLGKSRTPSAPERWRGEEIEPFRKDRNLLLNLDYAALGSRFTHPVWAERALANLVYLAIIGLLAPFGKCPTSPLLPVPVSGIGRKIALAINRLMPFDR